MKTALLFLFLTSSLAVFSQVYPDSNSYCNFQPYYDYELCAKGLKDTNGVIVMNPRYSEIRLLPADLLLVSENEQYGVIDCNFEVVIPIQYKQLSWMSKYYRPVKADSNYYWLFETDTGKGLMNSSMEVIIPPENDYIDRLNLEEQPFDTWRSFGIQHAKTSPYFRVTSNGQECIYNEKGEIIVPKGFGKITCHSILYPTSTPKLPSGIFFRAHNDSVQIVISEKGEQLFRASSNRQLLVFSLDSATIVRTIYEDGTTQATCLETGATTPRNRSTIFNRFSLLFDVLPNQTFDVYGSDFQLIYQGEEFRGPSQFQRIKNDSLLIFYSGDQSLLLSMKGEILIQTSDQLFLAEGKSDGCILTIPALSEEEDTLRIYSSNGILKHSYVINETSEPRFFRKEGWDDDEDESDPLLFIRKGEKWGALDRAGNLIIPFKVERAGIPFRTERDSPSGFQRGIVGGYYLEKSGKMGAIGRDLEELYPFKYDTTFSAKIVDYPRYPRRFFDDDIRPEFFTTDNTHFCHFAIRKNKLYRFVKGKERICDSTFLHFQGDILLVGHALVNKEGKVIREVKKGSIHNTKKFFLHIQGDQAQVVLFSGEEGLKIERFKSAQVERDYVKVKTTDETIGAISLDGRSWLYEPKYFDISFTNFPPNHAWVKEDSLKVYGKQYQRQIETYEGRWKLVNPSYESVVDFPFAIPVNLVHYPHAVFESEGKLGVIDSTLNIIYPPEYEHIYPIRYSQYILLYKDGLWKLGHSSGKTLDGTYSCLSYQELGKTIALISEEDGDTLIGFVRYEDGFEWVVPMTEIQTLINTSSLAETLKPEDSPHVYQFGFQDSLNHWRVQSNEYIVNLALEIQYRTRGFPSNDLSFIPDFEFLDINSQRKKQQFFEEPRGLRSYRYVEYSFPYPAELKREQTTNYRTKCMRIQHSTSEVLSIMKSRYCSSSVPKTYKNYIYLDSVRPVQLSDILQQNSQTSEFLKRFITEELTTTQAGYEVCPDLDKSEEFMWSKFHFKRDGLFFPDLSLFLPYDKLAPYLTDTGKQLTPW